MKLLLYFSVSYIFITAARSSLYTNSKDHVFSFIHEDDEDTATPVPLPVHRAHNAFSRIRSYGKSSEDETANLRLDPVLNYLNSRRKHSSEMEITASSSTSSSLELKDWKDEWRENWIMKKFEAVNSSGPYLGDTVNMAGARPWGVPCGDPNQHDMPWGTCMLAVECDSEYRIYRGDYMCGRTEFICCALQLTAYDMYQGFDLSFEDSGLRTDTQEKMKKGKQSKEANKKNRQRERRKRKNARKRRKRQIRRLIQRIQKEIRRIINRQDRNATQVRKRKTKQLKRFIDMLKAQYKKDRKAVQDIHEHEMVKIDENLKEKLHEISLLNHNFNRNATFRDIVVNGTLNRQAARMLLEAYPELDSYINVNVRRRSGATEPDYLDYDVEYGMLYY